MGATTSAPHRAIGKGGHTPPKLSLLPLDLEGPGPATSVARISFVGVGGSGCVFVDEHKTFVRKLFLNMGKVTEWYLQGNHLHDDLDDLDDLDGLDDVGDVRRQTSPAARDTRVHQDAFWAAMEKQAIHDRDAEARSYLELLKQGAKDVACVPKVVEVGAIPAADIRVTELMKCMRLHAIKGKEDRRYLEGVLPAALHSLPFPVPYIKYEYVGNSLSALFGVFKKREGREAWMKDIVDNVPALGVAFSNLFACLGALRDKHIVHLDIAPTNITVRRQDVTGPLQLMLIDFEYGGNDRSDNVAETAIHRMKSLHATYPYIPPEFGGLHMLWEMAMVEDGAEALRAATRARVAEDASKIAHIPELLEAIVRDVYGIHKSVEEPGFVASFPTAFLGNFFGPSDDFIGLQPDRGIFTVFGAELLRDPSSEFSTAVRRLKWCMEHVVHTTTERALAGFLEQSTLKKAQRYLVKCANSLIPGWDVYSLSVSVLEMFVFLAGKLHDATLVSTTTKIMHLLTERVLRHDSRTRATIDCRTLGRELCTVMHTGTLPDDVVDWMAAADEEAQAAVTARQRAVEAIRAEQQLKEQELAATASAAGWEDGEDDGFYGDAQVGGVRSVLRST